MDAALLVLEGSRVEQLEKMQVVNNERMRHYANEIKSSVTKELESSLLDAAGLFSYVRRRYTVNL